MSATEMRKLMEAISLNENEIHDAISELEDLNEQMKDAINAFDNILRQTVGYDDVIYHRFKSYPGGHIMSSLGEGGYGGNDTTLDNIIEELYERASPQQHDDDDDEDMDESITNGSDIIALKTLASAVQRVWDQIAYDIPTDSVSSIDMIELATDAGRLEMNGYEEEQEIFRNLVKEHGILGAYKKIASVLPYDSWEAGGGEDSSWH